MLERNLREDKNHMKVFLTIILSILLFVVGLSFLSPRGIEEDNNTSGHFINKVHHEDYRVQIKRRDFIRERRVEKLEVLNGHRGDKQKAARSRHDDFMVFNNDDDSARNRHDDFK